MKQRTILALLLCLAPLSFVGAPHALEDDATTLDTTAEAPGNGDKVVIKGKVTKVTDEDEDEKNDTFEIELKSGRKIIVKRTNGETKDMALIAEGDTVEIEVKPTSDGNIIQDVIKIGG